MTQTLKIVDRSPTAKAVGGPEMIRRIPRQFRLLLGAKIAQDINKPKAVKACVSVYFGVRPTPQEPSRSRIRRESARITKLFQLDPKDVAREAARISSRYVTQRIISIIFVGPHPHEQSIEELKSNATPAQLEALVAMQKILDEMRGVA